MSIGAIDGAMSGLATAQSMFGATSQAATQVGANAGTGATSSANAVEQASVAVLRMALDNERSLVNILA
jgi:hypothetical protein